MLKYAVFPEGSRNEVWQTISVTEWNIKFLKN